MSGYVTQKQEAKLVEQGTVVTLLRLSMTDLSIAFIANNWSVPVSSTRCTLVKQKGTFIYKFDDKNVMCKLFHYIDQSNSDLPVSPEPKGFTGRKCFRPICSPLSNTFWIAFHGGESFLWGFEWTIFEWFAHKSSGVFKKIHKKTFNIGPHNTNPNRKFKYLSICLINHLPC